MRRTGKRCLALFLVLVICLSIFPVELYAAPGGDNVVINQAYGGGGNSGATYKNDFIELYNPTNSDISLNLKPSTLWDLDSPRYSHRGSRCLSILRKQRTLPIPGALARSNPWQLPVPARAGGLSKIQTHLLQALLMTESVDFSKSKFPLPHLDLIVSESDCARQLLQSSSPQIQVRTLQLHLYGDTTTKSISTYLASLTYHDSIASEKSFRGSRN